MSTQIAHTHKNSVFDTVHSPALHTFCLDYVPRQSFALQKLYATFLHHTAARRMVREHSPPLHEAEMRICVMHPVAFSRAVKQKHLGSDQKHTAGLRGNVWGMLRFWLKGAVCKKR